MHHHIRSILIESFIKYSSDLLDLVVGFFEIVQTVMLQVTVRIGLIRFQNLTACIIHQFPSHFDVVHCRFKELIQIQIELAFRIQNYRRIFFKRDQKLIKSKHIELSKLVLKLEHKLNPHFDHKK